MHSIGQMCIRDSDRNVRQVWEEAGYDRPWIRVYSCTAEITGEKAYLHCDFSIASVYRQPFLRAKALWEVNADGQIKMCIRDRDTTGFSAEQVGQEAVSDVVYESILGHYCIKKQERKTGLDVWVSFLEMCIRDRARNTV